MKRSPRLSPGIALLVAVAAGRAAPLEAGVVLRGKAVDAASTSRAVLKEVREGRSPETGFKVPLAAAEVTIELVEPGADAGGPSAPRSWKATTDAEGNFTLDTGIDQLPSGALFVGHAAGESGRLYSPFFRQVEGTPAMVNLYPTTESAADIRARVEVVYDVEREGKLRSLRVRATVELINQGEAMYVGRRGGSKWREVFRLPFPEGAKIVTQSSPDPASPGWQLAGDGRWLVIDTPIPGLLDLERQGAMGRRSGWQVTYTLPPRQTLVQEFPIPFPLEPQCFAAWCVHEDMALTSPQLDARSVQASDDPAAGAKRQFEIIFSNKETEPGKVVVGLTTDNLVLGQVSRGAARWVGGFVLVVLGAVALGLALGRKGPAAEEVLRGLSGDEVLDRIADLDGRWERKEIREREYRRWRGALVALAAEELAEAPGPAAERSPDGRGGARLPVLPAAARGLIERIEAIDRAGAPDPRTIAERAHLLEALLKALPRADGAPREKSEG